MPLWKKKNWENDYQEYYAERAPRETGKFRIWPHLLTLSFIGFVFVAAVGMVSQTMFEKLVISLLSPIGIVWLALMLMVYFSLLCRQKAPALIGLFCWLLLTVAGNSYVANALTQRVEAPYLKTDVTKLEPIDTLFVLGGGAETSLLGRAQASDDGDRIVTAATMYHAGLVKRFICTGTQTFKYMEEDMQPHEESAILLENLNVPGEVVREMRGENTSQETSNIKLWLEQNPQSGRIGILTSAWHLPRAIRLCKSAGITQDIVGVPANFRSRPFEPSPNLLVPSAENLYTSSLMIKEILAGVVGR